MIKQQQQQHVTIVGGALKHCRMVLHRPGMHWRMHNRALRAITFQSDPGQPKALGTMQGPLIIAVLVN